MRGIILLDNYFEDTEALTTIDVLKRAGIGIDLVNLSKNQVLTTQCGNRIIVEKMFNESRDVYNYDFLVVPGGRAVMNSLYNDKRVFAAIHKYTMDNKLVALICAAPILARNFLDDKEFTCFPGFEDKLNGKHVDKGVVRSENFITAKSMYYTIDFALEIVKYLTNNDTLVESLKGNR